VRNLTPVETKDGNADCGFEIFFDRPAALLLPVDELFLELGPTVDIGFVYEECCDICPVHLT